VSSDRGGGRPRVAVVIVSYNTCALTLRAVGSALSCEDVEVDVVLVDNASTDGSVDSVREQFPEVTVLALKENVGFGRANNVAFGRSSAPHVLLLNSDAYFADGHGLRRLVDLIESDRAIGVVGARLESPGGVLEFSARAFPGIVSDIVRPLGLHRFLTRAARARRLGTEFFDHDRMDDMDWLTGACLLIRRAVLEEVGGFDPEIFLYGEELEWCWRVGERRWRRVFEPGVTVVHERGASGAGPSAWKERLTMAGDAYTVRKHRGGLYFAAFFLARCVGLAAEACIQGSLGILMGSGLRRARARHAARGLRAWVLAVLAGGSSHPARLASRGGRP